MKGNSITEIGRTEKWKVMGSISGQMASDTKGTITRDRRMGMENTTLEMISTMRDSGKMERKTVLS